MNLSEKYAKLLGFNDYDIKLSKVIGLLHDIGRFEQLRVYHSFSDKDTIDHADYSVQQLFDKGLIKEFWKNEDDYEIIKLSIKYHNKHTLPNNLDDKISMHAKLIRDIDKLDIIYLLGFLGELNTKAIDEPINKEIYNSIMNNETAKYKDIKNKNDSIACQFAYAFDINNDICLKEFKDNLYYFYKQIDSEKHFKKIFDEINNYIDERIDKNVRN